MEVLDSILTDPGASAKRLKRVIDIVGSDGKGVRYGLDGILKGLLEPR